MTKYWNSSMLMQPGKGPMPKPEISSVAVSGMMTTFQPFSCVNSLRMRLIRVVLPAAGPPVRTMRVIFLFMAQPSFSFLWLNRISLSCFFRLYKGRISAATPPFSKTVTSAKDRTGPSPAVPGLTSFTPPISVFSARWVWP